MSRILVLSFSDLANDPRVSRQIDLLAGRHMVAAAGFTKPSAPGVEFIPIPNLRRRYVYQALAALMMKLGFFELFYWSSPTVRHAHHALKNRSFDLILANDLTALPLACQLEPGQGVIFDAHEYSPRELEDRFYWRFLFSHYNDYLCRRYLPEVSGMLTVCRSIAEEYRNQYGISPVVLTSAPTYQELQPSATAPETIRMVHHGGAIRSRKIELMIDAMKHLDERFHLDLMLVPVDGRYFRHIQAYASSQPRVRIVPPVAMRSLPRQLNGYDIGLFLLPPVNFNYRYALPNKFFEFIQARLAVAIGPSPEMAALVRQYDCGVVSEDFSSESFARELSRLGQARIDHFKQRSHAAAKDLCFEKNAPVLLDLVEKLLETA